MDSCWDFSRFERTTRFGGRLCVYVCWLWSYDVPLLLLLSRINRVSRSEFTCGASLGTSNGWSTAEGGPRTAMPKKLITPAELQRHWNIATTKTVEIGWRFFYRGDYYGDVGFISGSKANSRRRLSDDEGSPVQMISSENVLDLRFVALVIPAVPVVVAAAANFITIIGKSNVTAANGFVGYVLGSWNNSNNNCTATTSRNWHTHNGYMWEMSRNSNLNMYLSGRLRSPCFCLTYVYI